MFLNVIKLKKFQFCDPRKPFKVVTVNFNPRENNSAKDEDFP